MITNLVWPAVLAAVLAILSVAAAIAGADSVALPLGIAGLTFAVLSPRNY
jgi:mannose/fructose/N-acetylgalactosamine-specific phosphotransferase system component IIC